PEAEEVLRGARTRMARKPPALARELLRNFPKRRRAGGRSSARRRRKGPRTGEQGSGAKLAQTGSAQALSGQIQRDQAQPDQTHERAIQAAQPAVPEQADSGQPIQAEKTEKAEKAGNIEGSEKPTKPARQARPRRAPRRSANGKVTRSGMGKDAPSDAVLAEALSSDGATQAGMDGGLEPGSGRKLQKNVEQALDRADQPTDSK